MARDPLRAPRHNLTLAEQRYRELRERTDAFFAEHPYQITVAPHATQPDYDVYRFKLVRPVPRKVQRLARQTITALYRAQEQIQDQPDDSGILDALHDQLGFPGKKLLVPGVRAKTVLAMDGNVHAHPAMLQAPEWHPSDREVTILRRDPDSRFKGKVRVEFYFEFVGLADLKGQSALTVLTQELRRVEDQVA